MSPEIASEVLPEMGSEMSLVSASSPFSFALRVYWEDTDAGGVVFYANYLKYFERARTEWLRSLGFGQERMRIEAGVMFIVTDTSLRYLRPARLDDLLDITVQVERAGRAQMVIAQQAWRRGDTAVGTSVSASASAPVSQLLAKGTIRIGCVDAGTFKPQRIPISISEAIAPNSKINPSQNSSHNPSHGTTG